MGVSTNNLLFLQNLSMLNKKLTNDSFFVEYNHNLFCRQESLYQYISENKKIIAIIRGALASGVLQDNFFNDRIHKIEKEDFRSTLSFEKYQKDYQKLFVLKKQFDKENQFSLSQIALLYLINKSKELHLNASLLLGVKSIKQISELIETRKKNISGIREWLEQIEDNLKFQKKLNFIYY